MANQDDALSKPKKVDGQPDPLNNPDIPVPTKANEVSSVNTITASKFRELVDLIDTYIDHQHHYDDDYTSNCQCQCGRGSI